MNKEHDENEGETYVFHICDDLYENIIIMSKYKHLHPQDIIVEALDQYLNNNYQTLIRAKLKNEEGIT